MIDFGYLKPSKLSKKKVIGFKLLISSKFNNKYTVNVNRD